MALTMDQGFYYSSYPSTTSTFASGSMNSYPTYQYTPTPVPDTFSYNTWNVPPNSTLPSSYNDAPAASYYYPPPLETSLPAPASAYHARFPSPLPPPRISMKTHSHSQPHSESQIQTQTQIQPQPQPQQQPQPPPLHAQPQQPPPKPSSRSSFVARTQPPPRITIPHPYARLFAKKEVKRRKIWNHTLEKSLFTPYEISTIGAPQRRAIYTSSLEAHIDQLHAQLLAIGFWPVPFEELQPFKGLHYKTAKSMVSGLQHDASVAKLKLLELERANAGLRNTIQEQSTEAQSVSADPLKMNLLYPPPGPPPTM